MTQKPPSTSSSAAQDLERLAEFIITSLKELSSARQVLTPTSLAKALAPKRDSIHRLTRSTAESSTVLGGPKEPLEETDHDFARRAQRALDNEQQLEKQLTDLQKDTDRLNEFYKKITLSLILLANESRSGSISKQLNRLRTLISSDAPVIDQERCLDELKTIIFQEQLEETSRPDADTSKTPSFWSSWRKRPEHDKRPGPAETEGLLPVLQGPLSNIVDQFLTRPNNQHQLRFEQLRQSIGSCLDAKALSSVCEELARLIGSYLDTSTEERQQFALFVGELRNNFTEMETLLLSSLTDKHDSQQADTEFNQTLRLHMDDIRETVNISKTIEEVRGLVSNKLQAIRTALEEKRKQDEALVEQSNRKMNELQQHLQNMKNEVTQIQERTKSLEQEVLLDSLTNIHNRRAYEMRIDEELQRFQRYNQIFSLVIFDVDHFKRVNDEFGHRAGDKCLCEIVKRVRSSLRKVDFLARYGGEEFAIILPGTPRESAGIVAEKLRQQIERTAFLFQGSRVPVTISLGVTQAEPSDADGQLVFARADAAMYEAKREGRNRVGVR
jgi:diguanylate cyclase